MSTLTHGTDASKMESKEFQIDVCRDAPAGNT
jgi:hypothetical protein